MQRNEGLLSFIDWLTDPPSGGRAQMWIVGAGLASLTMIYAFSCVITQRATVPRGRFRGMGGMHQGLFTEIVGTAALQFGILLMFISLFAPRSNISTQANGTHPGSSNDGSYEDELNAKSLIV